MADPLVDRLCELDVTGTYPANLVSRQIIENRVVDVEPLGMMVE